MTLFVAPIEMILHAPGNCLAAGTWRCWISSDAGRGNGIDHRPALLRRDMAAVFQLQFAARSDNRLREDAGCGRFSLPRFVASEPSSVLFAHTQ
jgi:hypothetical protein